MLACCVIYIVYHIAHMHGTMVFARALLCLGRCLMATQHALSGPYVKRFIPEIASYKTDTQTDAHSRLILYPRLLTWKG